MTDLDHLSRLPSPSYRAYQASSYDRASTSPAEKAGWFANRDHGNFVRQENVDGRLESVMLEVDGPGAIVRIWSANPHGTIRIYVDGGRRPALVERMDALLGGMVPSFQAPLAQVTARGFTLYYPIPFSRHCKVTAEDSGDLYYQIDYRSYSTSTRVESFSPNLARNAERETARAIEQLKSPTLPVGQRRRVRLATGVPFVVRADKDGGVVGEFVALVPGWNAEQLRSTLLSIRFDGEETVRAPLDVLFGSGPGFNPYETLPIVLSPGGRAASHFPMPFQRTAEFLLVTGRPVEIELVTSDAPWRSDSLYFHARWHSQNELSTKIPQDWNLVTIDGEGMYVGTALNVHYFAHSWWGEGDEKIWVDGDRFPSWFGTGTEDYFGYAWCSNQRFSHPYHALSRADGPISNDISKTDGFGYTSATRWHIVDALPFTKVIQFDFEVLDWTKNTSIILDGVTYYYARPGAHDNLEGVTLGPSLPIK